MDYKGLIETVLDLSKRNELTFKAKATLINFINKQEIKQFDIPVVVNCATCKYVNITANNENHCRMCHNFSNHKPK